MTDEHAELTRAMADALRAELARQWGAEYDNYIRDVDWSLMARAALNAHRAHYQPVIGTRPVAEAAQQLSRQLAIPHTPEQADIEGLCFLLDLMDRGWHPNGFELMAQRNKLFNALGDALQCMHDALQCIHDAGGDIDDAAVQRITAVIEEMGARP